MGENSKIAWTDATWNPVFGCSKISAGCTNCYALSMAWRHENNPRSPYHRAGIAEKRNGKIVWTGKIATNEKTLVKPLRWKKPRRIFVNSMSDLFHENVPDEFIDRVFAVMALCDQHTFQVLTKRPERMRKYFKTWPMSDVPDLITEIAMDIGWNARGYHGSGGLIKRPLPNVELGVTAENQEQADARIPILRTIPAAKRFISIEPMLEPVDLHEWWGLYSYEEGHLGLKVGSRWDTSPDWVICGAESGPNRRYFDEDWARSLRDQCQAAGIPFMFKQVYRDGCKIELPELDGRVWAEFPEVA